MSETSIYGRHASRRSPFALELSDRKVMPVTFKATSSENLRRVVRGYNEDRVKFLNEAVEASAPFATRYTKKRNTGSGPVKDDCERKPTTQTTGNVEFRGRIVQLSRPDPLAHSVQSKLGLVSAIMTAYNHHFDLVLDPNDVWITLLAQFSAYVNGEAEQRDSDGADANEHGGRVRRNRGMLQTNNRSRPRPAEQLHTRFTPVKGQEELVVRTIGTLFTADFAQMTVGMLDQICAHLSDASLREWLLPGFSTSTLADNIAAAASSLSKTQTFFHFAGELECGIPAVTLLGDVTDWHRLQSKVERFADFDLDDRLMTRWLRMLRPICSNFVRSFEGDVDLLFWDTVCHHLSGGSGSDYLSGWVTAFSAFDTDGSWQADTVLPATKSTEAPDAAGRWIGGDSQGRAQGAPQGRNRESLECFVALEKLGELRAEGEMDARQWERGRELILEEFTLFHQERAARSRGGGGTRALEFESDEVLASVLEKIQSGGRGAEPDHDGGAGEEALGETGGGYRWAVIDMEDLNANVMAVPLQIDDNGVEYSATLFAGQFVFDRVAAGEVESAEEVGRSVKGKGGRGGVAPASGRGGGTGGADGEGGGWGVRSATDWGIAVNEEEVERAEDRALRLADCRSLMHKAGS